MIDTKPIRNKILELAIRGKLTDQLPSDGNAEDLYRQIQEEKTALIKEGLIKKNKQVAEIKADEFPFEIPSNWKWVRICDVFTLQSGKNIPAANISETRDVDHLYTCYGGNGKRGYVSTYNVSGRHVLIGRQGALCGNINVADGDFYATEHAVVVYQYANTDVDWASLILTSLNLNQYATSVAQPGLAVGKIEKVQLPLPPLSEQKRIVNLANEVFTTLDSIDVLQGDYTENLISIKNKIIDAGIRGELTEHLYDDGTAEELFHQIQSEKSKMIKEKKIKNSKPLPEITDSEIPFDIPDNWKWVRVGDIAEVAGGTTPNNNEISTTGTIPYFKVSDMNVEGNETHMNYASNYVGEDYKGKIFSAGTTIFPKNGGAALTNKRRLLMVPSAVDLNTGGCSPIIHEMVDWIRIYMNTIDFGKMDTGSNIPTVNATNLKRQLIPLPPLPEQKRIVEIIDNLLAVMPE